MRFLALFTCLLVFPSALLADSHTAKFDVQVFPFRSDNNQGYEISICESGHNNKTAHCRTNASRFGYNKYFGTNGWTPFTTGGFADYARLTNLELVRRIGKEVADGKKNVDANTKAINELTAAVALLNKTLKDDYVVSNSLAKEVSGRLEQLPLAVASDPNALQVISDAVVSLIKEKYELTEK